MIDVHCHVQFQAFENDYDAVIKDALSNGISKIINVGTRIESSQKAVEFAERYDELFAIVGVHPHHADKHELESDWLTQLEKLANHPKVLAIGEIGLDYFSYKSNGIVDPKIQKIVFLEQLRLANKLKLPLQIHNRLAGEDILDILEQNKYLLQKIPGMFHCFAGTNNVLERALKLGFYIGFDGNITYKGLAPGETVSLADLANETPMERIVVETDSPYLSPIPERGKRNEPKNAIITASFIANLKNIPLTNFIERTNRNVYNIFGKLSYL